MKALIIALALGMLAYSSTSHAQHGMRHPPKHDPHHGQHGHYRHHNGSWVWVPAALITGAIAYELGRQRQSPPVIVEREPVEPRCSEWREIQESDGRIYRERTCRQ